MSSDTGPSGQTGKNNKELHKEVLGGIVTANGFFTGAVFLSVTGTVTPLSGIPSNCVAGIDISLNLFLFQVWSLGFYFLSSLIATATKLVVVYYNTDPSISSDYDYDSSNEDIVEVEEFNESWQEDQQALERQEERQVTYSPSSSSSSSSTADHQGKLVKLLAPYWRSLMIFSVAFSAVGSVFLLLSIINLVQIKLGLLSCGSTLVVISVLGIAVLILLGLVVYFLVSWYFLKHVK